MRLVGAGVLVMVLAARGGAEPRAPGVYPVLVVHGTEQPHAYVLGCASVPKRGKPVLLGPKPCAALLKKQQTLELIGESARTAVKITGAGRGTTCPEGNAREPYVVLSGLPEERYPGAFVVAHGVADAEASQEAIDAIAKKYPPSPGKRPLRPGEKPGLGVAGAFDLDGDGIAEVIVESLGRYQLFRANAALVGTVGCEYG
ncbi:MAG: hypothetical protein JNL83_35960 [Myxococcales bacterium]|nr:hypothetical protein [Myxococcales bacterium]